MTDFSLSGNGIFIGDETANVIANSQIIQLANSSDVVTITPTSITVGNSSANIVISSNDSISPGIVIGSQSINSTALVSGNTFLLGSVNAASNGFCFLPNEIKMNWGWVKANTSAGVATFSSPYNTVFSYSVTLADSQQNAIVSVSASNTTTLSIRTTNTGAGQNCKWFVIGV